MTKQRKPKKLNPKDKNFSVRFEVPYKAKNTIVSVSISYDGACFRSYQGLASFTYVMSRERDTFCGARQAGTGVRNFNKMIKAYNEWDKKDFSGFWNGIQFDTWAV